MEQLENQPFVVLGVKIKPGPLERYKLENFGLDNTVDNLKAEAGKKINEPSSTLEAIHHGKILRDDVTLQESGVKIGEMIHVVKKKVAATPQPAISFPDAELQQLNASLRTLGCTPNAPGWTRAMQDLAAALRRVASFFGKQLSEDDIMKLCEYLEFKNFKQNPSVNLAAAKECGLLNENEHLIRKGVVGNWIEHFDEEMIEQAERWMTKNMRDTDLQYPY